ncbi:MAG TPA: YcnI family protein [Actinoplanes sp.]|nr:YcnI family protein [Actinoplanes sp.]
MTRTLLVRAAAVITTAATLGLALAGPASAHVGVTAVEAVQGGYTKVSFRVPNESDSAATTKVEVHLPTTTPIASVSLKPVTGWTAVATTTKLPAPVKTADGEVTEAITKITWTASAGASLKAGQFQEFDVSLGPLPAVDQIAFKTLQTYSDGTVVRWIELPSADGTEPGHPAPVLKLAAAQSKATPSTPPQTAGDGDGDPYGVAGIVLGLAGLVAGLLAYRRAARPQA